MNIIIYIYYIVFTKIYGIFCSGLDVCWIICDLTWTDVVEIKFNNFDLESSGSCAYDTLAVYDTSTCKLFLNKSNTKFIKQNSIL